MISEVKSLTFRGIEVIDVCVQAHIGPGLPGFTLVGLADKTIAESKERVRAALHSIGLALPQKKILISLAPADVIKEGSHFDLSIALCLLGAMEILPSNLINDYITLGELSLDGKISPVSGILPAAIGASARGLGLICPQENAEEAMWSGNENILPVDSIISVINHFKEIQLIPKPVRKNNSLPSADSLEHITDISSIKGLEFAKRAMTIAAAGGHNIILSGPPGAGKSMLASTLPSILPPLTAKEMLELSMIYSVAGLIKDGQLNTKRPFRAPHHSCSMPAMVGGGMGKKITPGEISLSHNGVLFLDELPEFPRAVIDSLRQPVETHKVLISRVGLHVTFPAKFQLVAAMNPCRCGYIDDDSRNCNKAPKCAVEYQSKVSGPIMDRFDLHVEVPATTPNDPMLKKGKTSAEVAVIVQNARDLQMQRYSKYNIFLNSELTSEILEKDDFMDNAAKALLNQSCEKLKLSMRGYYRIARVARTIADLEQDEIVNKHHIAEALNYRKFNFYNKVN